MKVFRHSLLVLICFFCCSFSFSLVIHQIGVTDPTNCATITYPGTSKLMVVNLFKVNNQVRSDYLDRTLLGTYNQIGSLGFSIQVPVGKNELEIIHLKRKEIVKITANFENKQYKCDFSKGYEIFEIDQDGNKKPLVITIDPVPVYKEDTTSNITLHSDLNTKHSPIIFRINGFTPSLERKAWNNYYFNDTTKEFNIQIPEGQNFIELSINTTSSGYSGQKYLIVQRIEFTAIKGKNYSINIHEQKVNKVTVMHATVDEM